MMKKINALMLLAAVFAMVGVFSACKLDTAERVTVTFEDRGTIIKTETIEKGDTLGNKLPEGLVGDGSISFYGWFNGASQYFADTPIGRNLTLTARWSDDVVKVSFAFTQKDGNGNIIKPAAEVPSIVVVKGEPLGPIAFPATPRVTGWVFVTWLLNNKAFTQDTPVPGNITLEAFWVDKDDPVVPPGVDIPADVFPPELNVGEDGKPQKVKQFKVEFESGPGAPKIDPILVYEGECIDEWEVRFPEPFAEGSNTVNPKAFFVAWFDKENREYNGRTPITRDHIKSDVAAENDPITAKWGLPPKVINFKTEVESVTSSPGEGYGDVNYNPKVREAWDSTPENPKLVIVNETTYDVPFNTNRWRILYRIKLKLPDDFSTGFYTRYTVRARFYANKQGTSSWTGGGFIPNNPAAAAGYSKEGLLKGKSSPSDDGWGQVSWCSVANWDGQGANADTMLQRYNLDRKGGTINDTWAPLRSKELKFPPFLLIQTSDNYIGHIEVTQIVFHNGEAKYTMYTDEEGYDTAEDGLK